MRLNFCALAWALATGGGGVCVAADPAPPAAAEVPCPKIQFESTVFDFGRVANGELVKHTFTFTNTGKATLEIKGVYPSCGCTSAGEWTRQVEPGATGVVPLQFNSTHFSGPVDKTATVVCTDESQPSTILQIKGVVWKPIEISPQTAVLNVISDSSNAPAVIRIVSNLDQPITLSEPQNTNHGFAAELKTIQPGKMFELLVRAVPPMEQNNVQATFTLQTSSTNVPTISINVFAIIQPAMLVMPAQIALPPAPLGSAFPCNITIRNNQVDNIQVSDPVINVPGLAVELKEVVPGKQFNLSVTFPAGFQTAASEPVFISVKTTSRKSPELKIPVYQGKRSGPPGMDQPNLHRGPRPPPQPGVPTPP